MPLNSKNLSPSQVTLRPATIEDKAYLYDLAKTLYKKLIIDQFGRWYERQQRSNFETKWVKATYHIIEKGEVRIGTIWTTTTKDHIRLN